MTRMEPAVSTAQLVYQFCEFFGAAVAFLLIVAAAALVWDFVRGEQ